MKLPSRTKILNILLVAMVHTFLLLQTLPTPLNYRAPFASRFWLNGGFIVTGFLLSVFLCKNLGEIMSGAKKEYKIMWVVVSIVPLGLLIVGLKVLLTMDPIIWRDYGMSIVNLYFLLIYCMPVIGAMVAGFRILDISLIYLNGKYVIIEPNGTDYCLTLPNGMYLWHMVSEFPFDSDSATTAHKNAYMYPSKIYLISLLKKVGVYYIDKS